MDKSLFIYILVGLAFFYVVTNFVGDIQAEDDNYRNNSYNNEHQYDKYQGTDSVGQSVLNVESLELPAQIKTWNASPIKAEWLTLSPNFSAMKNFVSDRVQGEALVSKLKTLVDDVEDKYFSGKVNTEQAKQLLDSL
jgi:hypothetical protein